MRDAMLIVHFIGLAMGLGTSFAMMFLGIAASKLPVEERGDFMLKASFVTKMGHIGLVLLFLSGGYMMTPYWSQLGAMPTLIAKLSLFVVLGGIVGIMTSKIKKAKAGDMSQLLSVKKMGPLGLLTSVAIVILAVLTFH